MGREKEKQIFFFLLREYIRVYATRSSSHSLPFFSLAAVLNVNAHFVFYSCI